MVSEGGNEKLHQCTNEGIRTAFLNFFFLSLSKFFIQLGLFYDGGKGVPQNHWVGANWFMQASFKGDKTAQHNLGIMYEYGEGVPLDIAQAGKRTLLPPPNNKLIFFDIKKGQLYRRATDNKFDRLHDWFNHYAEQVEDAWRGPAREEEEEEKNDEDDMIVDSDN